LYKLHKQNLQKPYAVYLYSHSVYIYIAAEVFSQTAASCNPYATLQVSLSKQ